ncbi:MAG TPA: hypothetical protein VFQ44_08560 [Streptosporangiaceae bacterium]|nr:hypothetical protein [Streptosporangiaceae bacterium]
MAISVAWQRYDVWNQALSSVLFTPSNEGRPVYLDMDDDVLSQVALEAGVTATDAPTQLADAVRATLVRQSTFDGVFEQHLRNLRLWLRVTLRKARDESAIPDAPPVLGLLAVLTLAAEEMQHDGEFGGNAYYPRLFRVLSIDDGKQQNQIKTAYRRHAEELWGGLNEWLTAADGLLGLPTAYALSHRYVGLPLSQALVRSADRRQFPLLFHRFGLSPRGEISTADMERLLDSWFQMRPCPVSKSLESLWQRGQARERIASVAAVELRSWDGTLADTHPVEGRPTGGVQLISWLRRFPKQCLEISFLADLGTEASPQTLVVLSAKGEPTVDVLPAPGGRLQPVFTSEIDTASLVEGVLRLAEPSGCRNIARIPRRVVAFRFDDLLNAYVECERVQLGEDSMLLVKADHSLPGSVQRVLDQTARPGFRVHTALRGLPAGWVLFADIQVVAAPDVESVGTDLNALIPLLSSQLALAGGTKLPGTLRKWSSLNPPEIRAVVQGATTLSLTLDSAHEASRTPDLPHTWTADESALIANIKDVALPDGDYEVSLLADGKPRQQSILRLRSSDTPDAAARTAVTPLAHDLGGDPLAVMRATPIRSDDPTNTIVRGPRASSCGGSLATMITAGRDVWWNAPKPPPRQPAPITLAALDPESCVVTGAHYIELPLADGSAKWGQIRGACKHCGLIKRYPAHISWYRDMASGHGKGSRSFQVNVSHLPEVAPGRSGWDVAFDGLVHVHGGSINAFEYVADQVEGSRLFTDTFGRSLEVRGDLEVERGPDFAPVRWELSPAYLTELITGEFLLTGSWSRDDKEALREEVEKVGGTLMAEQDQHGLTRRAVANVTPTDLTDIAATIGTAGVVLDAATRLVGVLPPLSALEASLPRISLPSTRKVLRFHLESASWVDEPFATIPGAYRLERAFTRTDVFRTRGDVEASTAALATIQLSKHLAARHSGKVLLAYSSRLRVIVVPLGADLPGLYGRAAVLCGGRLPTPDEKHRLLVYHDVPQHVADALTALLTS